ncbi:cytochrome P450 [Streptomyces sp. NPDC060334]|uniref:cytochrome P450 n=1 Tax=unclassified Streptomyces TaxID=2593676 RepID=UPI0006AF22EF|nr:MULTISPECIES: cytochrome P450 [unclassified Streptomyces]KOU66997.1 cytochrome P450 [Streptomyces sp. WM4235]MCX5072215.1 cytochrome P450 [Streptomyces sp. NBC_00424]MCX5157115.1 cytochrome P450 [Streptomyces sp. NBC_00291]WUD44428.1 cytochrome P450 [Streptomyces sp. NBC_00513]
MDAQHTAPVPPPGCPAHQVGGRVPLHGPGFAADPQAYYTYLRHYGPTAPVELAPGVEATLVTDYSTALQLLQDSGSFRKDARRWRELNEGRISPDNPVAAVLSYRPNCMFSDGVEHLRLRQAITDSMGRVDSRRLARSTEQVSNYLVSQFGSRGSADLLGDYAKQLPLFVFNELFGCPADIGDRVLFGITGMFDGVNAERAVEVLYGAVGELVALKRAKPGEDVTSWLMQHEAKLTDEEMVHQLALLLVAGNEPLRNLIGNTLHRLLTHDAYAHKGGLIDEALDDTLWENPPMQNLAPHYPSSDMEFAGQKVQAGDLMLVSFAAANTGPALTAARQAGSNRAHLAWSAGPHACPSKEPARQITVTAIENLLNRLPDVELSVPEDSLVWRPGPFNRGLATLPTRFTPFETARESAPQARAGASTSQDPGVASHRREHSGKWSQFLNWLTR